MPKDTFYRLPEEKKSRIIQAAEKEFLNNSFEVVSINRIIKDAEIPRGSFYQYFEDKKDIFMYIIDIHKQDAVKYVEGIMKKCDGDIFKFVRKSIDIILSSECEQNMYGIRYLFSEPWVFDMIFSDTMKEKMEGVNSPPGIMFKYVDRESLCVDSDEEIMSLISIFGTMVFSLFFKIFVLGKSGKVNKDSLKKMILDQVATLEKHYKK